MVVKTSPRNPWLQVPLEIIEYAIKHKIINALGLLVYLKMHCDGKVNENSTLFQQAYMDLGIKDKRTAKKYIDQLLKLGWLGYNPASGNYFVRSFSFIRKAYNFKKRVAATFYARDFKKFRSFCHSAIIARMIVESKWYHKRKFMAAANKRGVAFQPRISFPEYYGMANSVIAKKLGCKTTMACKIKNQAAKDKFLKVNHRFRDIIKTTYFDGNLREQHYDVNPKLKGKLFLKKKENSFFILQEQLYDEIIPLLDFKRISRFNKYSEKKAFANKGF